MKVRIITTLYRSGAGLRPDLGGEEAALYDHTTPRSVNFAVAKEGDAGAGDEVLLSLGGEETPIQRILAQSPVEQVTRTQVEAWRQGRFEDPSAEWGQARDREVDRRLEDAGMNPDLVRATVQVPSAGKTVLQDQEYHALVRTAQAAGRPEAGGLPTLAHERDEALAGLTRSDTLPTVEAVDSHVRGDDAAHNTLLDYVKGSTDRVVR